MKRGCAKRTKAGVVLLAALVATTCASTPSPSSSRAPEPRYLVSERPIDVGLGPWGLCVAVDPLDRQGVWWWEPGASGCRSRSTGPGVFAADRATVSPSGRDGSIAVSFRVQTHSEREPYREVRLVLERGSMWGGAEERIPLQRRVDLNLPLEPPGGWRPVG
jgi:hypothetical protein